MTDTHTHKGPTVIYSLLENWPCRLASKAKAWTQPNVPANAPKHVWQTARMQHGGVRAVMRRDDMAQ